jgi:hypothetical protein
MTALPPEFDDLSSFSDWCLPTEGERYAKRLYSSMEEMQRFYDVALPRLEEALAYLDQLGLNRLTPEAKQLLLLCYSLVNISFPVEVWRQGRVPDSGSASLEAVIEPAV